MREKENFGKKPVRRSTSEEKESPKVYSPRTAKPLGKRTKTEEVKPEREKEEKTFTPKKSSEPRESRQRDDQFEQRRPARKTLARDKSDWKGESSNESKTYKPRTLKSKSANEPAPKRERQTDMDEKPFRERTPERRESPKKSYYEEKYAKPEKPKFDKPERVNTSKSERSRYPKRDDEKFSKPKFEKREKSTFEREPKAVKKQTAFLPDFENLKTDKDGLIRLNKYIANSGLCSRREADEFITQGQISVNGVEVRELGTKVKLTDEVRFKGKQLDPEKKVYILLNKPKDYVTTVEDPNASRTVMELIEGACDQRVYPVGRLDRNSTGLLLFTNDGELTKQLTHPSFLKKKIYEVGLDRNVKPDDIDAIRRGINLDGEIVAADAIEYIDDHDRSLIGIEIHSGQNRVVRRIFETLNYRVVKLDRVYYAGLTKKNLPRGKWRFLNQKEVAMLKMNRFK